jgi:hypothetical protein
VEPQAGTSAYCGTEPGSNLNDIWLIRTPAGDGIDAAPLSTCAALHQLIAIADA